MNPFVRAWRATTRFDRLVVFATLAGCALWVGGYWAYMATHVEADCLRRYAEFCEGDAHSIRRRTRARWSDAEGAPLPADFPHHFVQTPAGTLTSPPLLEPGLETVDPAAVGWRDPEALPEHVGSGVRLRLNRYGGLPELTRDPWGQPWTLVVAYHDNGQRHSWASEAAYSSGPNQRFEWGQGDDVLVSGARSYPAFNLRGLIGILVLIVCPYLTIRLARLPRAEGVGWEVLRAGLIALPAWPILHEVSDAKLFRTVGREIATNTLWGPRIAVQLSLGLVVWGVVFALRLRWATARAEGEDLQEPPPGVAEQAEPPAPPPA